MAYFTTDIPCPSCGYNLRGLSLDHGCPECGLKIVSTHPVVEDKWRTRRIESEIDENLRIIAEEEARRARQDALVAGWEKRGERFDRILDRVEKLLDRFEPEETK